MKRRIPLFLFAFLTFSNLIVYSQNSFQPVYLKNLYARTISPNGKWIGSEAASIQLYNVETGEIYNHEGFLGLGNSISNNGIAVGASNDIALVLNKSERIVPQTLRNFWFCDINAITPDATRITGVCNNTTNNGVMYVPFYCDMDDEGNAGLPHFLPYPLQDFFGSAPQFVTATWISNDGHTILGNVTDWRGMYDYPIMFIEDNDGNWSYTLPSESLFNMNHLDIPENPWLNEPVFPEAVDFMSEESKRLFEQFQDMAAMGEMEYPDPLDFMDASEIEAYINAINKYNDWYYGQESRIKEYILIYDEVIESSVVFSMNDFSISPLGDYFIIKGAKTIDNNPLNWSYLLYKFNTDGNGIFEINIPDSSMYPSQILSDGTVIGTTPINDFIPTSFIMLPGENSFIPIEDYFSEINPVMGEWMRQTIPYGSGVVSASDDKSVFAGGLIPSQLANYSDDADFYYSTYIFSSDSSGVGTISAFDYFEDEYEVYTIQGIKILSTKDKNKIEELPKGVYIVNGKKFILN